MPSEYVLEVLVRRHVFDSERPFSRVLDGIFGGISQPDIGMLFSKLAASTSYREFSSLVRQAQGSADLIRFLQLDLDHALTLDPQAQDRPRRRLVRLIAGNPGTCHPSHQGRQDPRDGVGRHHYGSADSPRRPAAVAAGRPGPEARVSDR